MPEMITPVIDFSKMSWNPDVPPNLLGPSEYNQGSNIELDTRSIRKVNGEQELLATIPGTPVYVIGVNRTPTTWTFIVATREGKYYLLNENGLTNITPGVGGNPNVALNGYSDNVNITDSEVGGVVFINDALRPPMFFRPTDTEIQVFDSSPGFTWNYEATVGVTSVTAGFVRAYASAHGNVLVAGNLTKTFVGGVENLQATIRWSNIFGLGGVPTTWDITDETFGNEVDLPVRGPLVDGYHFQGNFYVASYWDTASIFPVNYQTTFDPIFSVRLINTGRGLLSNNSWTSTDEKVYGLDARDSWSFDGQAFQSLGNQRVKKYFYSNLSLIFGSRTFFINNTRKNQIELYYPSTESTSWCDKMISYRYDLDVWQPPRTINNAVLAIEGPTLLGNVWQQDQRTIYYIRGGDGATNTSKLIRKDVPNVWSMVNPTGGAVLPIVAYYERNDMIFPEVEFWRRMLFSRIFPEITGTGSLQITIAGAQNVGVTPTYISTVTYPINTTNPWIQGAQTDFRTLTVRLTSNDTTDSWQIGRLTLQITPVEQDV